MIVLRKLRVETNFGLTIGRSEVYVNGWITCSVSPEEPATATEPGFRMEVSVDHYEPTEVTFGSGETWRFYACEKGFRKDWSEFLRRIVEREISLGKYDSKIDRCVQKYLVICG